ncbi:MAG: hypothetical protein ACI8W8_003346 [Rhodothermales bacterium]|jgi:hypothetical protein
MPNISLKCPTCSAASDVFVHQVVHSDDPTLSTLLAGKLNVLTCQFCDATFRYETPLLYRDDDRRHLIYFMPPDSVDGVHDALKQVAAVREAALADTPEESRPTFRLVLAMRDLFEKIMLLQQGLDDRIVEFIKNQLYDHAKDLEDTRHDLLFDFNEPSDTRLHFLAFCKETGQASFTLSFLRQAYEELADYYLKTPTLTARLDDMFNDCYVNVRDLRT